MGVFHGTALASGEREVWIETARDTKKENVLKLFRDFCDNLKVEVDNNHYYNQKLSK